MQVRGIVMGMGMVVRSTECDVARYGCPGVYVSMGMDGEFVESLLRLAWRWRHDTRFGAALHLRV